MLQQFHLEEKTGARTGSFDIRGAVCCGYTGRNQEAVKRHIDELAREGIKPPPSVPMFYLKPPAGVELDGKIYTEGLETSGEIEYVLLVDKAEIWVGLGSDHTDRNLEKLDIPKSKQVCSAPMSRRLWKYGEIKGHWDQIQIRSWATQGGKKLLYQESTLATILPPEELIRFVQQRVAGPIDGIAIYSGTPPTLTEGMIFGNQFDGELFDPVLKRKISLTYIIDTMGWFRR
jgi:hypothetical protein